MIKVRMGEDVVIIAGPTAVGKTTVGHNLASIFNGEIISADARQVYRYLDIGTAKPPLYLRKELNYWLIDIIFPDERYSAANFKEEAEKIIDSKNSLIFIVGGTGLYIRAIKEGIFKAPPQDKSLVKELEKNYSKEELYSELNRIDKEAAKRIHPNDKRRIIRALEVFYKTGVPISKLQNNTTHLTKKNYHFISVYLTLPKEELKRRIMMRTKNMLKEGLIEETERIINLYSGRKDLPGFEAIGYREVIDYLDNRIKKDELEEKIAIRTFRYAQRQIRWFSKYNGWKIFYPDQIKEMKEYIESQLYCKRRI